MTLAREKTFSIHDTAIFSSLSCKVQNIYQSPTGWQTLYWVLVPVLSFLNFTATRKVGFIPILQMKSLGIVIM